MDNAIKCSCYAYCHSVLSNGKRTQVQIIRGTILEKQFSQNKAYLKLILDGTGYDYRPMTTFVNSSFHCFYFSRQTVITEQLMYQFLINDADNFSLNSSFWRI